MNFDQADATGLVVAYYNAVLGRLPDPFGYDVLVPLLEAGYDPGAVRAGLAYGSSEAATRIGDLYQAELGRAPDPAGLAVALNALANGASLDDLRTGIAASPEENTVLSEVYQQVLGRSADASGFAQYHSALTVGLSLDDMRTQLATSGEATRLIAGIFQAVLGRDPSAGETSAGSAMLLSGGPAAVSHFVAFGPESAARLTAAYASNFGSTPSANTLSVQEAELAAGRAYADVTQVTLNANGGGGSFNQNYGYLVPMQYSPTGSTQFLSIYNTSYLLYQGGFTTVPIQSAAPSTFPAGSDTIVLDLQTLNATPLSFMATLDGQALGGATVAAPEATVPNTQSTRDEITFSGAFGAGFHQLHIQVTSDPSANALVIASGASFDGNVFLLGSVQTSAAGAVDIFPHPGPQPALVYGQT
jgi:hypothetical protein